jgi:carboxynorspermidine decarboxylase
MQYSFVKNTTFNGTPLPDIGLLDEDGSYRVVSTFGYDEFRRRLGRGATTSSFRDCTTT